MATLPLVFLGLLIFWPVVRFFALGISFESIREVFESAYFRNKLLWTIEQAVLSAVLTLLVAIPAAITFSSYRFYGRSTLQTIFTLPLVVPTVVAGTAWLALLGPTGLLGINLEGTPLLVLAGHIFYNYGMASRIISDQFEATGPHLLETARSLGSSPTRALLRVTLPLIRPAILSSALLVFLYSFASFGLPLILGGQTFATLEVEIYNLALGETAINRAGALALLGLLITIIVITLHARVDKNTYASLSFTRREPQANPQGLSRFWIAFHTTIGSVLTIVPLLALIGRSFVGESGFTLEHYGQAFAATDGLFATGAVDALINSLRFTLLAIIPALIFGCLLAIATWRSRSGLLEALTLSPLTVSSVTVSIGLLVAYPLLRANPLIFVGAYAAASMPLVARSILPSLRSVAPEILDAARTLGSSPMRVFVRIILPLLRPALATAVALAFASGIGEFASSLVLSRPEWTTLTVSIMHWLGRPGGANTAAAIATVLLAITTLGFLLINRLGRPRTRRTQAKSTKEQSSKGPKAPRSR